MSARRTSKPSRKNERPVRGRADLGRLRRTSERVIASTSPSELADLPEDFWGEAVVIHPSPKKPISLRVDADVLKWFKAQGPRYQSRMNAVLRAYMAGTRSRRRRKGAA
jgi:uncharacterized protein (DUF4415 family)